MLLDIPTNNHPVCIRLELKTSRNEIISIIGKDINKPNTYYVRRDTEVNGKKIIDLKFPATPKHLNIAIFNKRVGNLPIGQDNSFSVKINTKPLPKYKIDMTEEVYSFMKFALHFSENASILMAGSDGTPYIYKSDDGKYQIDYYSRIYDQHEKNYLTTPARIGHQYGIIEVAKDYFLQYTVPMRFIILLHEFSHKYLNPKQGFSIDNEFSADINALYYYLGTGFSEMEAITAFATVFNDAQTELNDKRMRLIMDFVEQWNAGNIATKMAA